MNIICSECDEMVKRCNSLENWTKKYKRARNRQTQNGIVKTNKKGQFRGPIPKKNTKRMKKNDVETVDTSGKQYTEEK